VIPTLHPFPARMAPELALNGLRQLAQGSLVLDPMSGSGTVLRQAGELGHHAIGVDMDPLAVLMSRVWTRPVSDVEIERLYTAVVADASATDPAHAQLPWMDEDEETLAFVKYWFAPDQLNDLRRIASVFHEHSDYPNSEALDVLRLALSRIIITKERGASLARDTSHSRPHKVAQTSDYSVFGGFERSVRALRKRLISAPPQGQAEVLLGDARAIDLPSNSVDAVLTSPPYLNAIDYMRGHRMALVWLGYSLSQLRSIRSNSIGAERGPEDTDHLDERVRAAMGEVDLLPTRQQRMIDRYVGDVNKMVAELARVLRPGGRATFVIGNSCLKGVFIYNDEAIATSAELLGMTLAERFVRELPNQSRYLPIESEGALGRRMRTETIMTFVNPAN
jgi:DNA modification methylase